MAFLTDQKGVSEVVGVDGVRKALDEFSTEHERFELKDDGVFGGVERIIGKGISLLRGDFFDLEETMTDGQFDAIYDRASMVAIRPELREKYVDVIRKLIKPGGNILLVTLDRREGTDEAKKAGPPFSVDEKEVERLYGSQSWVQSIAKVEEVNEFEANPGGPLQNSDLTALYEICFIIKTIK
jgi:thiopurine S-methyltransferase